MTWTTPPSWSGGALLTPVNLQIMSDDLNDLNTRFNAFQGIQSGTVFAFVGTSLPTNYLWCDGSAVSRTIYSALYAALGGASSPWGQGDGTSSFNLPDLRSRASIGSSQNNGTPPALGAGLTARAVAALGGEENHLLTTAETGSHTHTFTDAGHTHTGSQTAHSHTATDSGHSHSVTDPRHTHPQAEVGVTANSSPTTDTSLTGFEQSFQIGSSEWGANAYGTSTTSITIGTGAASITVGTSAAATVTTATGNAVVSAAAAGSGTAHNTVQPFMAVGHIIRV